VSFEIYFCILSNLNLKVSQLTLNPTPGIVQGQEVLSPFQEPFSLGLWIFAPTESFTEIPMDLTLLVESRLLDAICHAGCRTMTLGGCGDLG